MTRTPLMLMLAAAAALAGCNKESHTIVAGGEPGDNEANATAANANVQLPPSILATKLYRCADNSVVTVDYLSDNKSANVRLKEGGTTQVTATDPGKPMAVTRSKVRRPRRRRRFRSPDTLPRPATPELARLALRGPEQPRRNS